MRNVPNTTGSNCNGETSWEDGNFTEYFTKNSFRKNLIKQADSVPLILLFQFYKVELILNRKAVCPFPLHKNGRENTASFIYYYQTNSFNCFGCKRGGHCTDFVSAMENIPKEKAAAKILQIFEGETVEEYVFEKIDFSEKLDIMLQFSEIVRDFQQIYVDEKSKEFIEKICCVYDTMNIKHKLDNDALSSVVKQLKSKIDKYKLCLK